MESVLRDGLFPATWLACGGLVLGAASLVDFDIAGLARRVFWWLMTFFGAANLGMGVALSIQSQPVLTTLPFFAVGILHFLCFIVPTRGLRTLWGWVNGRFGTRKLRFAGLALVGSGSAVVLLHWTYLSMPEMEACELSEFAAPDPLLQLEDVPEGPASTDRGRAILLRTNAFPTAGRMEAEGLKRQIALLASLGLRDRVIHLPVGWQNCNCHGWVFTNGKFWVGGDEVEKILRDNRYRQVEQIRVGDLVVYRKSEGGSVSHTGIVRYLGPGGLILVESKWGNLGRFLHPHNVHCYVGDVANFYRSARKGHILQGLQGSFDSTVPDFEMLAPFSSGSSVGTTWSEF